MALWGLSISIAMFLIQGYAFADKSQTIVGHVSDNYEIIAEDGTVYYIAENEKGEQVAELFGAKVSVTGVVKEYEDMTKEIVITSYKILEKTDEQYFEDSEDEFE